LEFEPVTLDRLVDSPLVCGRHVARFDLAPGMKTPVTLNLISDAPDNLALSDAQLQSFRRRVIETHRLSASSRHPRECRARTAARKASSIASAFIVLLRHPSS